MPATPGQSKLRIAFAGTPEFSVPALEAMAKHGYPPLAVLTQPDRPAGRGRTLQASAVKTRAEEMGIHLMQPASLSGSEIQDELRTMHLDLMIVVAYGLILPPAVLAIPRYGCWNIHASLLPRWRGAAPIQRAIEAGDKQTGVSIMQMAAGLDTGPVYFQMRTRIGQTDTGGSLHDRLATMGAEALLECLDALDGGNMPPPVAQDEAQASYASKLNKVAARLDWQMDARVLERRVRAFNPWPVCWCELNGRRLRVWRAEAIPGPVDVPPGSVCSASPGGIDVATSDGMLRLLEIQAAGGKRMPVAEYLKAHSVRTGE